MLRISSKTAGDVGASRRDFLRVGALGALGLTLPGFLRAQERAGSTREMNCILIFNLGAPSQLDLFDPKPRAPSEIRSPFTAIPTASRDIQLTELLPLHAKVADRFSLVRSVCQPAAVPGAGHSLFPASRPFTGGFDEPHFAGALSFLHGSRDGVPGHVVLPGPRPPEEIGDARLHRGLKMRDAVDRTLRDFEAGADAALMDENFEAAYRLVTSVRAREAFDLTREPDALRDRYGRTRFGQSCLLARRLIEAGVRFVSINTFVTVFNEVSWDIHGSKPFTSIRDMKESVAPMYDRGYSALIEDLSQRGLLGNTMVANLAEFGRSPRINPAGGRDHWPGCWTVYFAGGGVKGGRVIGRSDDIGAAPAERPVTPAEISATMLHSLGVDPDSRPPGAAPASGSGPIKELF